MVNLRREIKEQAVTLATTHTEPLPREHFYRQIHLIVSHKSADPTSGVANANRVLHDVLTRISVRLGGSTVPFAMSALSLAILNAFDNGVAGNPMKGQPTKQLADPANGDATNAQDTLNVAHYWIDFNLAPTDQRYMIPSGELATFDLILEFAASVGATSLWTTDMGTTPDFTYRIETWEKITGAVSPGDLGLIFRREFSKALGTGTGEIEFELPLGNIYRRILVYYKDANGKVIDMANTDNVTNSLWGGNTVAMPVSDYRVEINGIEVVEKRNIADAILDDHFQYGVVNGLPYGAPSVDSFAALAQNHVAAAHIIDFDLDIANLDDVIDSASLSSFKIIWDGLATNGTAIIVTEEIRPPN